MVSVGTLNIIGKMDTSDVNQGFNEIENGFERTEEQGNRANATMSGMASTAGSLATTLGVAATAGAGMMGALASQAPQVTPHLAQMKVDTKDLSHSLGRSLEPAFESSADAFGRFVDFVESNEGTIKSVTSNVVDFAEKVGGEVFDRIQGSLSDLKGEIKDVRDTAKKEEGEVSEEDKEFNLPKGSKAGTSIGTGLFVGSKAGYIAGAATAAGTYGSLDQFERTMEYQKRVNQGDDPFRSAVKSFAPQPFEWFYLKTSSILSSSEEKEADMESANGRTKGSG